MKNTGQTDNKTICKKLFHDFRDILSWKWDDWIGTFLAEFPTDQEQNIRAVLEKHLLNSWDSADIRQAPPIVQKLDAHLGGLRPTQLLFSSLPSQDVFVFCAWWPWGSGDTISLRIAPFDQGLSKPEEEEEIEQLKEFAGI